MGHSPYAIEMDFDLSARNGVCSVTLTRSTQPRDRDLLLTEGLFQVIEFLVESSSSLPDGRAIVDIRLGDDAGVGALPGALAFTEAVRGLIQSLTLETDSRSPATNLIVSTESQSAARERTIAYLTSPGGGYSRGASYDLRSN
ncbi:hypothetical protein BH09ACT1_BH09ACT1_03850 [soil metagenome]